MSWSAHLYLAGQATLQALDQDALHPSDFATVHVLWMTWCLVVVMQILRTWYINVPISFLGLAQSHTHCYRYVTHCISCV